MLSADLLLQRTEGWQRHPPAVIPKAHLVGHSHDDVGGVSCKQCGSGTPISTCHLLAARTHAIAHALHDMSNLLVGIHKPCSKMCCWVSIVPPGGAGAPFERLAAAVCDSNVCSQQSAALSPAGHSPTKSSMDQMLAAVNMAVRYGTAFVPVAAEK